MPSYSAKQRASDERWPLQARMFFALWPPPDIQAELARHGRDLHGKMGGKATRQESIHLTLAFVGGVPGDRVADLLRIGAGVAFQSFVVVIDTAGCWGHNRVAWLGARAVPEALLALVEGLRQGLSRAGFRIDDRAYAAHVTVVRKADCQQSGPTIPPLQWPVNDFVLVRSQLEASGSRYTIVERWPAQAEPPDLRDMPGKSTRCSP